MGIFAAARHPEVLVAGQIGRDIALRATHLPATGESTAITERREMLGGKGANQAVGLAQLGVSVGLIGVVGEDDAGAAVLEQARADGIDISHVIRRGQTALLVDVVDGSANRQLFEHVPGDALLTVDDIEAAGPAFAAAKTVSLQLQQPHGAMLLAAQKVHKAGGKVVADGAIDLAADKDLFSLLTVFRADAAEAELIAGQPIDTVAAARALAGRLVDRGPELVCLAISGVGDLLAWHGGDSLFPHSDAPVVDRTGAGDAFVAGLIASLGEYGDPERAGHLAAAATSVVVQRLGGRPALQDLADPTRTQVSAGE
ncbi:PfkB family carbohydrate kinase [Mycolicibacterium fortuitum]|uniref:PfkB family carbohydrate kinase n=1 Tax=Mycolicibacterium fortuitum TaxID=1766 RepID=UPI00148FCF6F|nr:ribokinase [Mycolicibacterium fortuitum]